MTRLEDMPDPADRARAVTQVLKQVPQLTGLRGEDVAELLARPGATLRSVGDEIGIHWTTVKAIRDAHLRKAAGSADDPG